MKKFILNLSLTLFFLISLIPSLPAYASEYFHPINDLNCRKVTNFKLANYKLWDDHVTWTRNYIISDLSNLESKDETLQRLLQNQDAIGNSFGAFYGSDNGKKLSQLFREHISLAGQVVDAAKAGNTSDLEKYNSLWFKNADDIAELLVSLNPNYSKNTIKEMLNKHLQLVTVQAIAELNKDWKKSIAAYDDGEIHMLKFSDIITDGIIKQFPEKFK